MDEPDLSGCLTQALAPVGRVRIEVRLDLVPIVVRQSWSLFSQFRQLLRSALVASVLRILNGKLIPPVA